MIHYQKDLTTDQRPNMRGGNGIIEGMNLFTKEELDGHARVCDILTFDPGDSIGLHPHIGEGELYYILTGSCTVHEDGKDWVLNAGDCEYCPDGHTHGITNTGDTVMKMLAIVFVG